MSSPTESRLNLGCGLDYRAGYLNVDLHPEAVADQAAAALALEIQPHQLHELLLRDVIEHLGYCGFSRLLWRARAWLRAEGELHIETPDLDACIAAYAGARSPAEREDVLCHIYGIEDPGMSHLFCFPAELLRIMLEEHGFDILTLERFAERAQRPSLRCRARKRESRLLDERCALLDAISSSDEIEIRYADFKPFEEMVRVTVAAGDAQAYQALLPAHAVTSARLSAMLHARLRPKLEPMLGADAYLRTLEGLKRQAEVELFELLASRVASGEVRSFSDAQVVVRDLRTDAPTTTPTAAPTAAPTTGDQPRGGFRSDFFTRHSFARFVAHLHAHATRRGDAASSRALREVDTEL